MSLVLLIIFDVADLHCATTISWFHRGKLSINSGGALATTVYTSLGRGVHRKKLQLNFFINYLIESLKIKMFSTKIWELGFFSFKPKVSRSTEINMNQSRPCVSNTQTSDDASKIGIQQEAHQVGCVRDHLVSKLDVRCYFVVQSVALFLRRTKVRYKCLRC